MFVLLARTLDLAVAPLTWALLLVVLALFWTSTRPGRARLLLFLAVAELYAFSVDPVARRLYGALEAKAPSTFHPTPPYDVAVLLGGVVTAESPGGSLELNDASERLLAAADLLRTGQARTVLISGGNVFPRPGETPEAEALARWLRQEGAPADRVVTETASRNTRENALFSAPIIAAHGWKRVLIVTSAWHAPRALGCFRAVGIEPDVLAVDHRAVAGPGFGWLPRATALSASTDALRELFGGLVYRLQGWAG